MKEPVNICQKCGKEYTEFPALSRIDNQTELCSKCAEKEAMDEFEKMLKGK